VNTPKTMPLVQLRVEAGPACGKRFSFRDYGMYTIGRSQDCDCQIVRDHTLSREHFRLEIDSRYVALEDLNSAGGTLVDGVLHGKGGSLEPAFLTHGQVIGAGATKIRVEIHSETVSVSPNADANELDRHFLTWRTNENQEVFEDHPKSISDRIKALLNTKKSRNMSVELSGYREMQEIARGTFAVVFKCKKTEIGKTVAIKVLRNHRLDPDEALLFRRERTLTRQLQHQNVVPVNADGQVGDVQFIEMPLMTGGTLGDLLNRQGGTLPINQALLIMIEVLEGLRYAHQNMFTVSTTKGRERVRGLVHRDIKPSNILFEPGPSKLVSKVADFGLSKTFLTTGRTIGQVSTHAGFGGTPAYIAPEQVENYRWVKPSADVFGVAATFFHVISGHKVWPAGIDPCKQAKKFRQLEPERLHKVLQGAPKWLYDTFDCALDKHPQNRPQDAGELLDEIRKHWS
jgi:eukaryotic-like serine/threonine-protein kinase